MMANRAMYGPPAKSLLPTRRPRGGLLGNMANPLMYAGLGLLSQGPSLTPISPFQGLGQGLALGMQANRDQREAALDQQRMEIERQKLEAAARAAAAPSYTNVPGVGLVQTNAEGGPSVAVPKPADPFAGTKSVPGVGLVAMGEEGPEVVVEAKPTTSISLQEPDKAVGSDAQSWVMPDGSMPSTTLTPREIEAAGGRLMSPGEEAAATEAAKREQQQTAARANVEQSMERWQSSYDAWKAEPTPENRRKVKEEAWAVALARQALLNQERELSGATQRALKPPGAMGRAAEEAFEWLMGFMRPDVAGGGVPLPESETVPNGPQPLTDPRTGMAIVGPGGGAPTPTTRSWSDLP